MTRTYYEILDSAQQLLKSGWTNHFYAVDSNGKPVDPHSDLAVKYCTRGALEAIAYYEPDPQGVIKYCVSIINAANPDVLNEDLTPKTNIFAIEILNDSKNQEYAINMLERAKNFLVKHSGLSLARK